MKNGSIKPKHTQERFLLIVAVLVVLLAGAVFFNLPKPQHVSDSSYDLDLLTDGIYQGECNNGLVFAKVQVEIVNHAISKIDILEHRNGMGQAAEAIADKAAESQSLEVDAVSGATFSSQTILKAVENALSSKNKI